MQSYGPIADTIASIYSAFLHREFMPQMLHRIAEFTGGQKAFLVTIQNKDEGLCLFSHGHDKQILDLYNDRYFHQDPRIPYIEHQRYGSVSLAQDILPNERFSSTEYYDYMVHKADVTDCMYGVFDENPIFGQFGIAIHRDKKSEFFNQQNSSLLQGLLPHINNAQSVAAVTHATLLGEALKSSPTEQLVLLVGRDMKFIPIGDQWYQMFANLGFLQCQANKLMAKTIMLQSKIQKLVDDAIGMGIGGRFIQLGQGEQRYMVKSGRVPEGFSTPYSLGNEDLAVIQISKIQMGLLDNIKLFSYTFGLTEKEAIVLNCLSETFDLKKVALRLGLSYQTVRWHLRHIFEKTQTNSQSELLVMLSNFDRS
ncbi:helix-turn-helix transcriptional regulator [Hirschia litorea]|uniref:Helix-turn-helix transcriptional regulator n=1 Tax=Hirschia litorea TaxID=1199156 RepID=A0ABW2IHH8_9PROT